MIEIIVVVVLALVLVAAVAIALTGAAICAVHPPLRPVAEVSVLGRRAVGFAKFALATAAVIDLLRLGRRRRSGTIDVIVHRLGSGLSVSTRAGARAVAAASVSSWWVIVGAFVVSPMAVVLLVALVTRP